MKKFFPPRRACTLLPNVFRGLFHCTLQIGTRITLPFLNWMENIAWKVMCRLENNIKMNPKTIDSEDLY
jgi:hypothetical protein